jgi:SAM-dependent methyltransferase
MDNDAYKEMIALQEQHWWFVGRQKVIKSFLSMEKLSELGSEVLEVGCGVGGNVNLLSSTTSYLGIDMHLPAVDYCKEKYPQQSFRCSRIEDLPSEVKVRNFDSIYFLDVLEHLDQDVLVLRESSNFLKHGGKVLITVPAFNFLWSPHDEFVHHVRRYTKSSLGKSLEEAGYNIERMTYFNFILFPLAMIQRVGMKLAKKKLNRHISTPPYLVNWIFEKVFSFEAVLLKYVDFPVGLSIIAVVTKKQTDKHL